MGSTVKVAYVVVFGGVVGSHGIPRLLGGCCYRTHRCQDNN